MDKSMISFITGLAKRMRVMIVDEDSGNRAIYKKLLKPIFSEVYCVAKSRDAYIHWSQDKDHYDLIIIAVDESDASTLELLKLIRKKSYEQKFIIALASDNYNELYTFIPYGIEGVIKDPYDKTRLNETLYHVLREISDRKLLNAYVLQLGLMAKSNTDLRIRARNSVVELQEPLVPKIAEKSPLTPEEAPHKLIDKYAIRASFKDSDMADAVRDMDICSIDKIDLFRENIHIYHQDLLNLDLADADTTKAVIIKTTNGLLEIIEVINELNLFPVTVQAALHMANFLSNLDPAVFEDNDKKHLALDIIIALFDDLDKWIETVFINQDLEFVNYFDASFANTCLELESAFATETSNSDDDDSLEFF